MKRFGIAVLGVSLLSFAAVGCSGDDKPPPKTPVKPKNPDNPNDVSVEDQKNFDAAIEEFKTHEKANDWAAASCNGVAQKFLTVNGQYKKAKGKDLPMALYNAGLAYQRCQNHKEAKAQFGAALAADPKFHRAKVQVALYKFRESGEKDLEGTIKTLQQAVLDAQFQNTDALVNLAMLQMRRNSNKKGTGCNNDLACAKKNIQRALAVDDSFMPAFNQLAIYYLEAARKKSGAKKSRVVVSSLKAKKQVDKQQLELAALVCDQAIRKNANYAPIHNTAGLIQVELKRINTAVAEFNKARKLDPRFFEAQMNYAAVNLGFRGFKKAEEAYRAALKIKPNDFDAHLGLALAVRGQINDSNWTKNVKEAENHLDAAKKLDANRPETYYNKGILVEEYKLNSGTLSEKQKLPVFDEATNLYKAFIGKAGSKPEFAAAVKRAKERMEDIAATKQFIVDGMKMAKTPPPPPPPKKP